MTTGKGSIRAAVLTFVMLIAGIALFFQHTRSSSVAGSGAAMQGDWSAPSVSLVAQYEPEEIVSLRDRSTRVFRVVRDFELAHPDGQMERRQAESRIVWMGTNLCYQPQPGFWVPSDPRFEQVPGGFVSDKNNFAVTVGQSAASGVMVTMGGVSVGMQARSVIISDGLKSQVLGTLNADVAVQGGADGSTVRFARSFGDDIDLEYVVGTASCHQNVVFKKPIALPEGYDGSRAYIYVYSRINLDELIGQYGLHLRTHSGRLEPPRAGRASDLLGALYLSQGDAQPGHLCSFIPSWAYDTPAGGGAPKSVQVEKQLLTDEAGETYLVERIPYRFLEEASFPAVLDWELMQVENGSAHCEARYTYYVSNPKVITGTLSIEPGTTIKFGSGGRFLLAAGGEIQASGEPWNFITFTSVNDDNCGEEIGAYSNHNPQPGDYMTPVFLVGGCSAASSIRYCKIAYATWGVCAQDQELSSPIENNVIRCTGYGINLSTTRIHCKNNLIVGADGGMHKGIYVLADPAWGQDTQIQNNSIDGCNQYWNSAAIHVMTGSGPIEIHDNLFSDNNYALYNESQQTIALSYNGYYPNNQQMYGGYVESYRRTCTTDPYANVDHLGEFYLDQDAGGGGVLRDAGSVGNPDDPAWPFPGNRFTVDAPEHLYTAGTLISTDTQWLPIDHDGKSGDPLDIGYHHNRVDVFVDHANLQVSAQLLIGSGAVVAMATEGHYLFVVAGGQLLCVGEPYIHLKEECDNGYNIISSSAAMSMLIESPYRDDDLNPLILLGGGSSSDSRVEYTVFRWLGAWGLYMGEDLSRALSDNVFALSYYGLYAHQGHNRFKNNLFYENGVGACPVYGHSHFQTNTFDRCNRGIEYQRGLSSTLTATDCLFTENDTGIYLSGSSGTMSANFNAYFSNDSNIYDAGAGQDLPEGPKSIRLHSSPYCAGRPLHWENDYRLDQESAAVNAGSNSAAYGGLAAYTTDPNGTYDVGYVDTAFHYLARPPVYVDRTNEGSGPDGSRLGPYATIGEGLGSNLAVPGTAVLVLPGTYLYENTEQVTLASSMDLIGSGQDVTVLDGQYYHTPEVPSKTSYPLIKIDDSSDITLAGLNIRGRYNEDEGLAQYGGKGGGVICVDSGGVEIRDCIIAQNEADYGGGLYIEKSAVEIADCIIHQNKAFSGVAGGGVYMKWCNSSQGTGVTIRRCIISNNAAGDPVEPATIGGGGIYCCCPPGETMPTDALIEDCIISHNRGTACHGGGIYLDSNCPVAIRNCIIEHNAATYDEGPCCKGRGGGIYVDNSSPTICGSTISSNSSLRGGSGINLKGASCHAYIVNCTIVDNSGPEEETAAVWGDGADATIVNSIIWGNVGQCQVAGCDPDSVTYSCVQGGFEGDGNIPDPPGDPEFPGPLLVGSAYGPYHLANGSPCLDRGTTSGFPQGYTSDVDGDPRQIRVRDPGDPAYVSDVDMGSDERHPFRQMVGIEKDSDQKKVTITWDSEDGAGYKVYMSDDPFSDDMIWDCQDVVYGTGSPVSWADTRIDFETEDQRYYKVLAKDGTYAGAWTRPVGFVNAEPQYFTFWDDYESSFLAIPLELKYQPINSIEGHENEGLGSMLGENLEEEDRIEFLKLGHPDEETQWWTTLWLNNGKWCIEEGGTESDERFSLGEVFRIVEAEANPSRLTFLGYVPLRPVRPMVFRFTTWKKYVEFGYPYPVHTTLNDIRFIRYYAFFEDDADEVHIPKQVEQYVEREILWLDVDDDGYELWKYQNGADAESPHIDVVPGKGFCYYGKRGREYIGTYMYCRRVPVVRPYRSD